MSPIDITAIERRARQLRAAEMRHLEDLAVERLGVCLALAGQAVAGMLRNVAAALRPLFHGNPQRHA